MRAPEQLPDVLRAVSGSTILSLGVVDGRNIWRTDLEAAHRIVRNAVEQRGSEGIWIAPSCSLLHSPVDLGREQALDSELQSWLAFAVQKLGELRALATAASSATASGVAFDAARTALATRRNSRRVNDPAVRARM